MRGWMYAGSRDILKPGVWVGVQGDKETKAKVSRRLVYGHAEVRHI
jgi:hypothetical protein